MAHVNGQSEGLLLRGWHRLFGRRATQLTEAERPRSFLAYVLMGTQGAALVLVFGHTEIHWLEAGNPIMFGIVGLSLFVLVATAIAAQNCAIACMRRVGILMRNGAYGAAFEHVAYIVFVLLVEILTYGIAIYVLETNPQALLSDTPIIPFGVTGMIATIALRAAYIGWTEVQLQIVSAPLPPQWETFLERGKAMIGGHGQSILESMHLASTDLAAVARAFAEMSKPAVKRKTWWNSWLLKRDEEYRTALDEQARRVSAQLLEVGGNHIAEVEARHQADMQRLADEKAALIERAKQQIEAAQSAANQQAIELTTRAITSLFANESLPEWLIRARPELAGLSLPTRGGSRGKGGTKNEPKAPQSRSDALRMLLTSLDLTPANAPNKRRGIWLKSSDIGALSGGQVIGEQATKMAQRLGESARDGVAYIAPLEKVMAELSERHKLADEVVHTWASLIQSGENTGDNGELNEAIIPMEERRMARG